MTSAVMHCRKFICYNQGQTSYYFEHKTLTEEINGGGGGGGGYGGGGAGSGGGNGAAGTYFVFLNCPYCYW